MYAVTHDGTLLFLSVNALSVVAAPRPQSQAQSGHVQTEDHLLHDVRGGNVIHHKGNSCMCLWHQQRWSRDNVGMHLLLVAASQA
jgi:hypothetical protein